MAAAAALLVCGEALAQFPAVASTPTQIRPAVDEAFTKLMASPRVQQVLDGIKADHARSVEDLRLLTEIEAPPFKEQKRAEAFLGRMKALGLPDAYIDAEGNVIGMRKAAATGPSW